MKVIKQFVGECNRKEFEFSHNMIAYFPHTTKELYTGRKDDPPHMPLLLCEVHPKNGWGSLWYRQPIGVGLPYTPVDYMQESKYNVLAAPTGFTAYEFDSFEEFMIAMNIYNQQKFVTPEQLESVFIDIEVEKFVQTMYKALSKVIPKPLIEKMKSESNCSKATQINLF